MGPHPGLVVWKCAEHFNKSNPADCDYMQCDKCKCRCDFDLCNECKTVLEAQPISSHPITSQLVTSQPITNQPTTSQPMWQDQPPSFEEPRPTKEVMDSRTHLGWPVLKSKTDNHIIIIFFMVQHSSINRIVVHYKQFRPQVIVFGVWPAGIALPQ